MQTFGFDGAFRLESGEVLPSVTIGYHTYGTFDPNKSKVVWICHALTANSDAADWWKGMVGENCIFDPAEYFVVCANILGSCYGTSGPLSINTTTGQPYYSSFPFVTIRDMVQAHILLRKHLQIETIHLLVGGSMGGYQALEWGLIEPGRIERLFITATSAAESAWGIAIHTAQRLAIEADSTWKNPAPDAGNKGLKAARAIGLLSYRNFEILTEKQTDTDVNKVDHFRASSYINYQGDKLVKRFNAYSYWLLTKAMDSHNIARGRSSHPIEVLQTIQQPTLVIGISSDILCPMHEQQIIAQNIPNATLIEIDSPYGHDGFIVEWEIISSHLRNWLKKTATR